MVVANKASDMSQATAVLLTAFGTPRSFDEVEPFYRTIRGGRPLTPELLQELGDRYHRVGGTTPLLKVTEEVAHALERQLNAKGESGYKVYIGMRYWHPFIAEAVQQIAADGISRVIGMALAPQYSTMSTDGYRGPMEDALRALPQPPSARFVDSWHANPLFIATIAQRIKDALKGFSSGNGDGVEVVFSAHSLPSRILQVGDPYPEELRQSCEAVAKAVGLSRWHFAYQSPGRTGEPWLGPAVSETLGKLASEGRDQVLLVPIGFVSDNLEIVYDIDVEAQELAQGLGVHLERIEMPNASPAFVAALAEVVLHGTGARLRDCVL